MNTSILNKLDGFNQMNIGELRQQYETLFGVSAPHFNRDMLMNHLSYRVQELKYGGLSQPCRKKIKNLMKKEGKIRVQPSVNIPSVGTKLVRTYQDVDYHVTVLEEGFEFDGLRYKSLSAVAKKITSTQWNGLVFFGLKSS
jgi:hypothetical protein